MLFTVETRKFEPCRPVCCGRCDAPFPHLPSASPFPCSLHPFPTHPYHCRRIRSNTHTLNLDSGGHIIVSSQSVGHAHCVLDSEARGLSRQPSLNSNIREQTAHTCMLPALRSFAPHSLHSLEDTVNHETYGSRSSRTISSLLSSIRCSPLPMRCTTSTSTTSRCHLCADAVTLERHSGVLQREQP